ncbi:MAG: sodium:solute symporter [Bacteroidales bacterium]
MNANHIAIVFICYTALLFFITYFTSKKATSATFFVGNRRSPWFVVAYGMVGASLSGVTFMSVPGNVLNENFFYIPLVFGFIAGYVVVATVLLPLYYKLNLISIYSFLEQRFGFSGSLFFIISRSLGATLRMFLVVSVLYEFVLKAYGFPFWAASVLFVLLILGYTFKGGIKTIVWTDTLQTTFMLLAVFISIYYICKELDLGLLDMLTQVWEGPYSQILETDPHHKRYFLKQFISGMFITITMTGLDQDMMQKNLSCRNLKDAQKNMFTFSGILLLMNICFLVLGAILVMYVKEKGILVTDTDQIFPNVAIRSLGGVAGLTFVIGVLSAAYSSADGALTALTTSFSIDILGIEKRNLDEKAKRKIRYITHFSFAVLFVLLILMFNVLKNDSIINLVYDIASYTYGPLLGLFAVGIYTKWKIVDRWTPVVVLASPLLCYLSVWVCKYCWNYSFGFELLLLNGLLTAFGLWLFRDKKQGLKI